MNLKNTSVILKKINRLYELINEIGEASSTENDLLKAYTLDLYEAVTMSDIEESKDLDDNEILDAFKRRKKQEKKIKKQIQKQAKEESIEAETEEKVTDSAETDHESQQESPPAEDKGKTASVDPEILSLFEMSSGSDLSDKLSLSPIHDLTKAMGINEKIFTINELFGGKKDEFENLMLALNGLSNFDEAKSILIRSVASKYEWGNERNQKKAKNFIRLVQRRFN